MGGAGGAFASWGPTPTPRWFNRRYRIRCRLSPTRPSAPAGLVVPRPAAASASRRSPPSPWPAASSSTTALHPARRAAGNGVSLGCCSPPCHHLPPGPALQASASNQWAGNGGPGGSALGGGIAVSGAVAGKSILLENCTLRLPPPLWAGAGRGGGSNGGYRGTGGNGGAGGTARRRRPLAVEGVSATLVGGTMTRSSAR